jgi:hypothetical protein
VAFEKVLDGLNVIRSAARKNRFGVCDSTQRTKNLSSASSPTINANAPAGVVT